MPPYGLLALTFAWLTGYTADLFLLKMAPALSSYVELIWSQCPITMSPCGTLGAFSECFIIYFYIPGHACYRQNPSSTDQVFIVWFIFTLNAYTSSPSNNTVYARKVRVLFWSTWGRHQYILEPCNYDFEGKCDYIRRDCSVDDILALHFCARALVAVMYSDRQFWPPAGVLIMCFWSLRLIPLWFMKRYHQHVSILPLSIPPIMDYNSFRLVVAGFIQWAVNVYLTRDVQLSNYNVLF